MTGEHAGGLWEDRGELGKYMGGDGKVRVDRGGSGKKPPLKNKEEKSPFGRRAGT